MKKISTFIYLTFILLVISCEKEPHVNLGFDCTINKNSSGLVIAEIWNNIDKIYLDGFISLSEGEMELKLLNPRGEVVYNKIITTPDELIIDEVFEAEPGYWKLKYLSIEGVGEIVLHLHKQTKP